MQDQLAKGQETLFDAEEMVLNMGPQHPSTHGVLRVILKLDGETVVGLDCDIGFLHRGVEKIGEADTYAMITPYWDRLDYVAAVSNDLCYVEGVEKMLQVEVPKRAEYVRVILTELQRIASHLLWLGTHAMDIGAVTVLLYCFREREEILKIFEDFIGARLTAHDWPGNVRELENLMRRLAVLARDDVITSSLVEAQLDQLVEGSVEPEAARFADASLSLALDQHLVQYFAGFGGALPPDGLFHRFAESVERPLLRAAMQAVRGNQIRAAKLLGINRNTLRKKLGDLSIDPGFGRNKA